MQNNADNRTVYSVAQINGYVKRTLDANPILGGLWIKGEISNLKKYSSGHYYFTLKDSAAAISAVMFGFEASRLNFTPENGISVIAFGAVSLYEKSGSYQLNVRTMELDGRGEYYLAFERLKAKLLEEGLFDPKHKRALPRFPRTVGVVTSASGAAVHDIIRTALNKNPGVSILLAPAKVQGDDAPESLIAGLHALEKEEDVDVIIIGRGGGSIEDLWAFNNEELARAVYACAKPVVSAVGHEVDFSICDFTADARAATPTAAAELCVPDMREIMQGLDESAAGMEGIMLNTLDIYRTRLSRLTQSLALLSPEAKLKAASDRLKTDAERMSFAARTGWEKKKREAGEIFAALSLLNPDKTLKNGYRLGFARVLGPDGAQVKPESIKSGDIVAIEFETTRAEATIGKVDRK